MAMAQQQDMHFRSSYFEYRGELLKRGKDEMVAKGEWIPFFTSRGWESSGPVYTLGEAKRQRLLSLYCDLLPYKRDPYPATRKAVQTVKMLMARILYPTSFVICEGDARVLEIMIDDIIGELETACAGVSTDVARLCQAVVVEARK